MSTGNDQMTLLRQMRNQGRISEEEYEDLRSVLTDEPPDVYEPIPDADSGPESDSGKELRGPFDPIPRPTLKESVSGAYLRALAIAGLGLVVASALGVLSWFVTISAILLLATTLIEGWQKVTSIGAAVVVAILLISLLPLPGGSSPVEEQPTGTLPPFEPEAVPGSLGVYMDDLIEGWNTVDGPPRITQGLTRYNETGEYDTFLYRFGEWGRFAGAFDPGNDAVYALLATGRLSHDATDQLFLHLCFIVAPYSQECIDSYNDQGLDEGSLEDFADLVHEAEWALGEHTWTLVVDQNILTIRVYGADAND